MVPAFAEDVADAHHGVLNVRAGLALEAERVFEVEGDHGIARELEHEVAQRADGDLVGDLLPLGFGIAPVPPVWRASTSARVAAMSLSIRSSALTPKPLRPLTSMYGSSVLFGDVVAKFHGAARRERDHLVAEVRVVIGLVGVAHAAQRLDHVGLRIGLARVDHVVDGRGAAEVRMGLLALDGRDPALVIGILEERLVTEVAAEQAELPKVVGDVFADIGDGAVGADDDLGIFIGLRAVLVLDSSWQPGRVITQQPLFLPSFSK